jgi:hypothetical protein
MLGEDEERKEERRGEEALRWGGRAAFAGRTGCDVRAPRADRPTAFRE